MDSWLTEPVITLFEFYYRSGVRVSFLCYVVLQGVLSRHTRSVLRLTCNVEVRPPRIISGNSGMCFILRLDLSFILIYIFAFQNLALIIYMEPSVTSKHLSTVQRLLRHGRAN